MTTKTYGARKVRIGKTYLHHTFAGVEAHSRITKIENLEKGIFMGVLIRDEDVVALRIAGVPYQKETIPSECVAVVYDFQIIREIRGPQRKNIDKKTSPRRRIVRKSRSGSR
jgi:hypothetical protein